MTIILFYDIEGSKLRGKVVKSLERSGLYRLQYSVFVGSVTQSTWDHLSTELSGLWEKYSDRDDKLFWVKPGKSKLKNLKGWGHIPDMNFLLGDATGLVI